jgi:hypothetical protein
MDDHKRRRAGVPGGAEHKVPSRDVVPMKAG